MVKKRDPSMSEIADVTKLSANSETVLVGGMAVSVLAKYFEVEAGEPFYTKDADFMGGLAAIEQAEANLSRFPVRKYIASMDEVAATPNFGKLAVDVAQDAEPIEIDFLYRLDGLSNDEIEQKSMSIELDGKPIRVIHPILAMENKIINLALFPNKRNESGIGQAALVVRIVNKYLSTYFEPSDPRPTLQAIERIARFAARDPSCFAYQAFGIEVLNSIPDSIKTIPDFREKRLPQIIENTAKRREKFSGLWGRMSALGDPMRSRFQL